MGTISVSLPSDGTTADVADVNTPLTTIVTAINGNLDNANIKAGASIATTKLASDNGISAGMISSSAITLGYAQITTSFATSGVPYTDVPGLSTTVTVPSGGRRVKITACGQFINNSAPGAGTYLRIVIDNTTQLQELALTSPGAGYGINSLVIATNVPTAGSHTYKVQARVDSGSLNLGASATAPAYILVEAI